MIAAVAVLLGSCSTMQVAQQSADNDDVYNAQAKAREVDYPVAPEKTYRTEEQVYGGTDYATGDTDYAANSYSDGDNNDYDYDYGYASRIDRFQYASPYRSYYNDWYTYSYNPWYGYGYDPFFYNQGLFSPGYSMWFGTGLFGGGFGGGFGYNSWGYGNPYYGGYWGPTSYYGGGYGGYGYGYGNGGYGYGGVVGNQRNNNPRPYLGSGNPNLIRNANRGSRAVGRTENGTIYERTGRPGSTSSNGNYARPSRATRPATTQQARPTRVERPVRDPYVDRTPPTQSSSPRSSGGNSNGGGGNSNGGGGNSRPSRGSR